LLKEEKEKFEELGFKMIEILKLEEDGEVGD